MTIGWHWPLSIWQQILTLARITQEQALLVSLLLAALMRLISSLLHGQIPAPLAKTRIPLGAGDMGQI